MLSKLAYEYNVTKIQPNLLKMCVCNRYANDRFFLSLRFAPLCQLTALLYTNNKQRASIAHLQCSDKNKLWLSHACVCPSLQSAFAEFMYNT